MVDALRKRHTYGTSGDRVRLDLKITERIELAFDVACPDAIEKVELFDGTECIDAWRHPFEEPARDDRIRVLGEGTLYRGRGRIIKWAIDTSTDEATIERVETINVFNRDRKPVIAKRQSFRPA